MKHTTYATTGSHASSVQRGREREVRSISMGGRLTRLNGSRLLLFNVCTSGVVYAAGDRLQQKFEGRLSADKGRWGRMAGVGAPIGAMGHYWYLLLDRILPRITARSVTRKVLADMCIFGPVCLVTFFTGLGLMEGKNSKEIAVDLKTMFPTAYLAEWTLWPAAQALNFYLIPSQLRVFYVSSVLLVWTVILSYIKHKER